MLALLLVPWSLVTIVNAQLWKYIYDSTYGVATWFFGLFGDAPVILGEPVPAITGLMVADIWKTTPFVAIILLAGLVQISEDLYEAAELDGANGWQTFWRVVVPQLAPTLTIAVLFRVLQAFGVFDLPFVLTNGGPGTTTQSLAIMGYKVLFQDINIGPGAAIATSTAVIVAVGCLLFLRAFRNQRREGMPDAPSTCPQGLAEVGQHRQRQRCRHRRAHRAAALLARLHVAQAVVGDRAVAADRRAAVAHVRQLRRGLPRQRPRQYMVNSIVVSVATGDRAGTVVPRRYALAGRWIKGRTAIMTSLLMLSVFPAIAVLTPLYLLERNLGLLNSYPGLIVPYVAFNLPFAIWIMRNYLQGIPSTIEEASEIDGAGAWRTVLSVILPMAKPGLFTVGVFTFTASWSEFLMALTFNSENSFRTIPVGIALFGTQFTVPFAQIFAASVAATIPIVILVLVFRRSIVSGLTSGAVKG